MTAHDLLPGILGVDDLSGSLVVRVPAARLDPLGEELARYMALRLRPGADDGLLAPTRSALRCDPDLLLLAADDLREDALELLGRALEVQVILVLGGGSPLAERLCAQVAAQGVRVVEVGT